MEALQLLQGLEPETTAVIDDLYRFPTSLSGLLYLFGVCGVVISGINFHHITYYMFLKANRYPIILTSQASK